MAPSRGLATIAAGVVAASCGPATLPVVEDRTPPTVRIVAPADGARIEGETLAVEVEYADGGSGVSTLGFRALLDGQDVSGAFDQHSRGATARIRRDGASPVGLGEHRLVVEVADRAGLKARAESAFLDPGSGWLTLAAVVRSTDGEVSALAVAPDGRTVAAGLSRGGIVVWEMRGGEARPTATLTGHRRDVLALGFTPDGRTLVSGGADRTVRLWDLSTPARRDPVVLSAHRFRVTSVAVSPDGRRVASASFDETIRVWDLAGPTPREHAVLTGHLGPVYAVAFSPDGRVLASAGSDETVRLWTLEGAAPRQTTSVQGPPLIVKRLAFAGGAPRLAMGGLDPAIRVVAATAGARPASLERHEAPVIALAFAERGDRLVSADERGRVVLWDTARSAVVAEGAVQGRLRAGAFSAGGSFLAAASEGGGLYVCRVAAGSVAGR